MVKRIKGNQHIGGTHGHTQADRVSVFTMIDALIDDEVVEEEDEAFDEFWGAWLEREDELDPSCRTISNDVYDLWFAFDLRLEDESRVVDQLLAVDEHPRGERRFMEALRDSSMRLYEIVDTIPEVRSRCATSSRKRPLRSTSAPRRARSSAGSGSGRA